MAKDLITLAEFKTYKSMSATNTERDALVKQLISQVSTFIKAHCKKTFIDYSSENKIEYFDAVNQSEVFLLEFPIINISCVERSLDGGNTYEAELLEFTNWHIDEEIGRLTSEAASFVLTGEGSVAAGKSSKSLKITYKGGYLKVPDDLKLATMDLVEYYRQGEYTPRKESGSFKLENVGFRAGGASTLPAHVNRTLALYRQL